MRARLILSTILAGGVVLAVGATLAFAGKPGGGASTALYPDLRTVVPAHLNLVNQQQNEYLRFSNGIANTGGGPWAMRPENQLGITPTTTAIQEIRSSNAQHKCGEQPKPADPCYTVVQEQAVSIFEYHPTHNHWHTADVARFEVRKGSPTGPVMGSNSIKVGFCLLDLYRLDGNAPTSGKTFWDCYTSYQGVSVGWVDQYHQATDGQQVVLTACKTPTTTTSSRPRTRPACSSSRTRRTTRSGSSSRSRRSRTATARSPSRATRPARTPGCAASGRRTADESEGRVRERRGLDPRSSRFSAWLRN